MHRQIDLQCEVGDGDVALDLDVFDLREVAQSVLIRDEVLSVHRHLQHEGSKCE